MQLFDNVLIVIAKILSIRLKTRLYNVFYYFDRNCEMEIESAWYYGTYCITLDIFTKRIENGVIKEMVISEKLCVLQDYY